MQHPISIKAWKDIITKHQPIDPIILEMLPDDSLELAKNAKDHLECLVSLLEASESHTRQLLAELSDLKAALEIYAQNSQDVLFHDNLQLCLQQVRQQRQAPEKR